MTLPKDIKLIEIDSGIRHLVVNLNRIPGIYTQTTCEGHVERDVPTYFPTTNGYIHFNKIFNQHDALIKQISDLFLKNKMFTLTDYSSYGATENSYTIDALFEPYQEENELRTIFNDKNSKKIKKIQEYLDCADLQKIEILKGWNKINQTVVEYIKQNISKEIFQLPYRNSNNNNSLIIPCQF
jgi:hypothetical protein